MRDRATRPLRVAMIGQKGYPPVHGGIEKHVAELAARLPGLGVEVDIYSRPHYSDAQGPADLSGVRVLRLPSLATKHLDAISHTVVCTLDALGRRPDVVHYHALGPGLLSGLPRVLAGLPTVVTVHGLDWQRDKWGRFARWVLRGGESACVSLPSRTIVVSEALREHFLTVHGKGTDYIPNGIAEAVLRRRLLVDERGIPGRFLLFVGRLVPEKGCHLLIEAWNRLDPSLRRDRELVIAGDAGFTPGYVGELRAAAGPGVRFLGYIHGRLLEELYSHAEMLVLPSTLEGLSITLLEGMSYGRCCLVSDIPPNLEAAGECAETFRSGDVADLASRLAAALGDEARRKDLGTRARERVAARYSWDRVAVATAALYRECAVNRDRR
ncbi:MAG: glycosyltransferase family 4 protein [Candidatus Krumholzibacteriia bacterium]